MGFWSQFEIVYSYIWEILDSPMEFGGISISFADILIASGVCWIIGSIVGGIINDVGD